MRDQARWDEFAALLNESIIREIIKGIYLKPVVGYLKGTSPNLRDLHKNPTGNDGEK
jgi:hypothetical protein